MELRKEFQAQEAALQRSLSKLRSELQKAQEEARENRDKTNRLQTSLANAEGTIKVELHRGGAETSTQNFSVKLMRRSLFGSE